MVVIEKFPCVNKRAAETREQYWIDLQNNNLNTICSIRDYHSLENKQKRAEINKKWYEKRTDEYKEQVLIRRRAYRAKKKEAFVLNDHEDD